MSFRPFLWVVCGWLALVSSAHAIDCGASDVNVEMRRLLGKPENVCQSYGGKVMLIVNVASHCGFTSQYEGLEKIYRSYRDQGLVVLGFPSGDFMDQEFDDEGDIQKFCKANFGVSFPMFGKTSVKGEQASPLFKTLSAKTEAPGWNFNKYLVGRDGKVIGHFGSLTKPDAKDLRQAIETALKAPAP
ncbi:MAG: glutathione peroxidase [Panacagrimonas sp.]|jgi:glutathione peroxidase|nr:glutathione peroxidase [Panacagrimonas sp.]MCC2658281.1 glutathione peroxidase [Panacagrimonas sp.]